MGGKPLLPSTQALLPRQQRRHINKTCALGGSGVPPTLLATGTSLWRSLGQHHLFLSLHKARLYINDFLTVQTYTEVQKENNEFLGEIGLSLWGMVKFLEASISMNNKQMDESDVSASVASPADYILYFSLRLDHLVSTSIDA